MEIQTEVITKDLVFTVAPVIPGREAIMELARKNRWADPIALRDGGMIDTPVIEGMWRFEPLIDTSIIPRGAKKRLDLILKSVPVQGVIIGHEIEVEPIRPKVEPLPWVVPPEPKPQPQPKPQPWRVPQPQRREIDWQQVGYIAWEVVKIIGIVAVAALGALALLASIFTGCMTDPTVIVVTQEGEWIEIYRYYS